MDDDVVTTTRGQLVAAFMKWDANAKAGNWPSEQNAEASVDYLIRLLNGEEE
jgi:hypothetical protein